MAKQKSEKQKTYSIAEVGEMLGIGKNAAYNAAHRGEIPTLKIGGRILVPKVALDRLLEQTQSV
ncbi:MAG TPA: helix-turn-helix domain-containing protein [Acidobacteriota bacterium]|nr:helix-turn-helix domain-containing protein [Acidobacteriota bacterium]